MMALTEIHAVLQKASDGLKMLHGQLGNDVRPDSAFAIGQALGTIDKAKALIGRDIDDAAKLVASYQPEEGSR
jgi:hypothetical protein